MNISTETTTTPCVGGGQNSKKYWVGGSNILPITRAKSIQAQSPNDFCSASIIAKNCMEVLPDIFFLPSDESKSNITLTSLIAWIRSYMENNGKDIVFRV